MQGDNFVFFFNLEFVSKLICLLLISSGTMIVKAVIFALNVSYVCMDFVCINALLKEHTEIPSPGAPSLMHL